MTFGLFTTSVLVLLGIIAGSSLTAAYYLARIAADNANYYRLIRSRVLSERDRG